MTSESGNIHRGINAIVVDDDKDVSDVFMELLQINGINVIGKGTNGKDAVDLYKRFHPDVTFMDALMPQYDGFYGLEKIKEYDPSAIVILVTGSANVENKLDCCSATAILEKPIDMNKITNILNRLYAPLEQNQLP
ncbi:MAG: response regulator [Nitrosotalea sp.]